MKNFKLFAMALAAAASAGLCHAQYRCGNAFQDRPCDAASVRPAQTRPAAADTSANLPASSATSPFATTCARWGKTALEVAWRRETGVLREAQFANPASSLSKAEYTSVVDAVYARRGTAPELRAAAETECMQQKQRDADAVAALAAIGRSKEAAPGLDFVDVGGPIRLPTNTRATNSAGNSAECASIKDQLAFSTGEARRGGSVGTMERINNERRALESRQSKLKC